MFRREEERLPTVEDLQQLAVLHQQQQLAVLHQQHCSSSMPCISSSTTTRGVVRRSCHRTLLCPRLQQLLEAEDTCSNFPSCSISR